MSELRSPYDSLTIAEIIHDYAVVRGDLTEQYARDQLAQIIERRLAEKDAEIERLRESLETQGDVSQKWQQRANEARAALADVTRERDDLRARVEALADEWQTAYDRWSSIDPERNRASIFRAHANRLRRALLDIPTAERGESDG